MLQIFLKNKDGIIKIVGKPLLKLQTKLNYSLEIFDW